MSRVYIARCPAYEREDVDAALQESLQALNHSQPLIRPGQRVILKVSLLQAQPPERGITTHPAVVAAVARWVRERGATPIIADSPMGPLNPGYLHRVYRATGMAAAAEESGAFLNEDTAVTRLSCVEGCMVKSLEAMAVVASADAVISLPKLKTHGLMQLTAATKNLFGTIPGITKAGYHTKLQTVREFAEMLIDIVCLYRPVLTITDAVVGMDENGPSGGRLRQIGLLLASTDAIASDVVATSIIGWPAASVPPLAAAMRRGLTTGRVEDIEVWGARPETVRVADFRRPRAGIRNGAWVPQFALNVVTEQLVASPRANAHCTACGTCVENCPQHCITIVHGQAQMDFKRCIRCYCCHEDCPSNAIDLHQPILGRLLNR